MNRKSAAVLLFCGLLFIFLSCGKDNDDEDLKTIGSVTLKIEGKDYKFKLRQGMSTPIDEKTLYTGVLMGNEDIFNAVTVYITSSDMGEGDYSISGETVFEEKYKKEKMAEISIAIIGKEDKAAIFYKINGEQQTTQKLRIQMKDDKKHYFLTENLELTEDSDKIATPKKITVKNINNLY